MIKCNSGNLIQKAVQAFLFSISYILSNQGNRNTNDGIALAQTIEGALDETTNMLQRIRTLAVQAANGTNTAKDRKALQEEVDSLCYEVSRIAYKTTFAGTHVLMSQGAKATANGQGGTQTTPVLDTLKNADGDYFFQVGANSNDMIKLSISSGFHMWGIFSMLGIDKNKIQANGAMSLAGKNDKMGLYMSGADKFSALRWVVSTPSCAQATLAGIDQFIEKIDSQRAALGAIQNHSCDILAA